MPYIYVHVFHCYYFNVSPPLVIQESLISDALAAGNILPGTREYRAATLR
ncbi:MAG: hypothetical protein WC934_11155 [Acidithiobacillus sp.]|jgi:hypothetical protein